MVDKWFDYNMDKIRVMINIGIFILAKAFFISFKPPK